MTGSRELVPVAKHHHRLTVPAGLVQAIEGKDLESAGQDKDGRRCKIKMCRRPAGALPAPKDLSAGRAISMHDLYAPLADETFGIGHHRHCGSTALRKGAVGIHSLTRGAVAVNQMSR